ncbi:MAG: hypothetical protein AMXMBFR13_17520 [Phycisphaerae bacterium]
MNASPAGKLRVALAILLSLAGLAVSAKLLLDVHVKLAVADASAGPACGAGGGSACDAVLTSRWGRFPFGRNPDEPSVPTALLGFMYFAATSSWFFVVGRPSGSRRGWHLLAVLMTAAGAAFAGYMAWVMYTQLAGGALDSFSASEAGQTAGRPFCLWCAATQVAAGLLFLVTLTLWPRRPRVVAQAAGPAEAPPVVTLIPDHPSLRYVLAALLMAAGISGFAWSEYQRRLVGAQFDDARARLRDYDEDYEAVFFNFMAEPQVEIPVTADDSIRGHPDAPHTVVIFADFQCPYCQRAEKILREKVEEYPDRLRVVFKHFPMNKTCNQHVQGTPHPAACAAAITVEAARVVGGEEAFWKMFDELYANAGEFAKAAQPWVKNACEKLGIDHTALWRHINTRSAWKRIREHADQGNTVGVNSTPVVYYDGRKVGGWANSKFWDFLMYRDQQQPATRPAAAREATRPAAAPATRPQ